MPLIELTNLDDARLRAFSSMTDSELRDPKQLVGLRLATGSEVSDEGLFIVESRNVIDRAMDAGLAPFALLTDKRWAPACEELFARIDATAPATPLFVGTHQQVFELTGYERTRGPLAAFHRPPQTDVATLLKASTRVGNGCCAGYPRVPRPVLSSRQPRFHGNRVPGTVDAHRNRTQLGRRGSAAAKPARIHRCSPGAGRRFRHTSE